jgi:DNA-binding response OmpR family regulator
MKNSVLVVEDDTIQADSIAAVLRTYGFRCRSVLNAEAAISVLAADRFGYFLVDLYMPGMDGIELIQKIRGVGQIKTPVVLMTAAATDVIEDIRSRSDSLQPLVILQKPFAMELLFPLSPK